MADEAQTAENQSATSDNSSPENKDDDSFGIASGMIPDNALFSSSALNQSCGANQARLNNQPFKEKYGAWTPMYDDKNQYLDVDLGEVVQVGAIATQGRPAFTEDGGWFVESYSLAYGNDGDNFQNLREYGISKVFEGNTDTESIVKNQLKNPIKCRYIRIKPVTWHIHIALRVEIYKYTGSSQGSRKRSTPQRQPQKSNTGQRASRPMRGNTPSSVIEEATRDVRSGLPGRPNEVQQICVTEPAKESKISETHEKEDGPKDQKEAGILQKVPEPAKMGSVDQESFEVLEPATEDHAAEDGTVSKTVTVTSADAISSEKSASDGISPKSNLPEVIPLVSVRDQANVFANRPDASKVDPAYHNRIRGSSAVETHRDGSKFIGKIKLVKRDESMVEEEAEEKPVEKKGPEVVVPDVVKERLTSYQDVVLRKKDSKNDASKRKSIALEEDLKYREQMESSVLDRLKAFKESESKSKENLELSKQEEEKRLSLKRDAEKRRSLALQKEKERMLGLLQKQKEEEEEQKRKREEASVEEFVEIDAEVPGIPAVVNDRLKLFKESERHEKEKQEVIKMEAEKRRLAKESAEKKREAALQKEKERLQELMNKKQEEQELRRLEEEVKAAEAEEDLTEEPVVPAIVHDRIKMFKDSEKINKEKEEALRREAQSRRAAEEDAERTRISSELQTKDAEVALINNEIGDSLQDEEEQIVVVQENLNVESEISFDFMEETEAGVEESFKDSVDGSTEKDENQNDKEALDLQKRLENIDTHHDGYDPDHERHMLEEADAAFRNFASHQKGGSRPKRSAKTENLIKSFTSPTSNGAVIEKTKPGSAKREQKQKILENITSEKHGRITNVVNGTSTPDAKANDSTNDRDICLSGLVKDRASLFLKNTPPPASGDRLETAHSNVKKWIASQPPNETEDHSGERQLLNAQLKELERKSNTLREKIDKHKADVNEEEVLELEEQLHVVMLELSKTKRKLLKLEKEHRGTRASVQSNSMSSETRSIPDDNLSDKASSMGSRSHHDSSSSKLSKECKAPSEKPPPPVDTSAFNDDGEIVVEGNVLSQIKNYEDESARQRKKMAEIRKSLSLSRSSLDSYEDFPPMGYGGAEFAKDKSKSSRECKLPRETPVPPVDYEHFNDDGDCVPEGNVHHQMQLFSKS